MKNKNLGLFAVCLIVIGVAIAASLIINDFSLSGRVVVQPALADSSITVGQAQQQLRFKLENKTIEISGSTIQATVIKVETSVDGSLKVLKYAAVGTRVNTTTAYLVVAPLNEAAIPYVGQIIYKDGSDFGNLSYSVTSTTNNPVSTAVAFNTNPPTAWRSILYQRFTSAAVPELALVLINGGTWIRTSDLSQSTFQGFIYVVDGYNEASDKGGVWEISFNNEASFGIRRVTGGIDTPRSIYYTYYKSGVQMYKTPAVTDGIPNYKRRVKNFFRSPAGISLTSISRNLITFVPEATTASFGFECVDSDPSDNGNVIGEITMRALDGTTPTSPHYSNDQYRDTGRTTCNPGFPQPTRLTDDKAELYTPGQVYCNSNQMPAKRSETRTNCPTILCSFDTHACGPAVTCIDSDPGRGNGGAGSAGTVTVRGSSGQSWEYSDFCIQEGDRNTEGLLQEYYCEGSGSTLRVKTIAYWCGDNGLCENRRCTGLSSQRSPFIGPSSDAS